VPPVPPLLSQAFSRRTTLALAGVGLVAVGGCDDGGDDSPAPLPSASPDPDTALVDRVVTRLTRAERIARGAGLAGLAALHRAHLEALDASASARPHRKVPADVVRRHERRLQSDLVAAAMAAQSGALARLLASMSAAVSQHLAVGDG
jgi:hypothetical protein